MSVKDRSSRAKPHGGPWFVYIMRCRDGSLYTGIAKDVKRRCQQHNAGTASRYTRSRRPVKLIYQERHPSQSSALKREAAIKTMTRPEKLGRRRETRNTGAAIHLVVRRIKDSPEQIDQPAACQSFIRSGMRELMQVRHDRQFRQVDPILTRNVAGDLALAEGQRRKPATIPAQLFPVDPAQRPMQLTGDCLCDVKAEHGGFVRFSTYFTRSQCQQRLALEEVFRIWSSKK